MTVVCYYLYLLSKVLTLLSTSDHFNQILSQFSQAMVTAIQTSHPHCKLLEDLLSGLCSSETRTTQLTEMVYEWCSVMCRHYSSLIDGKDLLSLKIGFHHLNLQSYQIEAKLTHGTPPRVG